ncbi:hypothetical protein Q3G72_006617 [Acer saccharum]|nr:hypothetical protein Q3G72_006617 [Acer saccharum]
MINGMHVYSWPIQAKVAEVDWNKRRQKEGMRRQSNGQERQPNGQERKYETKSFVENRYVNKSYEEKTLSEDFRGNRTFKDAVKGNRRGLGEQRFSSNQEVMTMQWYPNTGDREWLSRCAVGILKSFSKVTSVCNRLSDRGFSFSSHYLGDKFVLWCFETELEKSGFINNRFLWDVSFRSMHNWAERFQPKHRRWKKLLSDEGCGRRGSTGVSCNRQNSGFRGEKSPTEEERREVGGTPSLKLHREKEGVVLGGRGNFQKEDDLMWAKEKGWDSGLTGTYRGNHRSNRLDKNQLSAQGFSKNP